MDLFSIIQDDSVTNRSQLFSLIYTRFNKDYIPIIEFLSQQEIREKLQEIIRNKTKIDSFIKAIITDINQNVFSFDKDSKKSLTDLISEKFEACKNKLNEKLFPTFLNCFKINQTLITNVFLRIIINIGQTVFQNLIETYIQTTINSYPNQIFTNVFFLLDLDKKLKLYKYHLYLISKLIMLYRKLCPQNCETKHKMNDSKEIFLIIIVEKFLSIIQMLLENITIFNIIKKKEIINELSILLNDGFNLLSIQKTSHFYMFEFINCYIHSLKSSEIIKFKKEIRVKHQKFFKILLPKQTPGNFKSNYYLLLQFIKI